MNINERVISVLDCKYVYEVVIGDKYDVKRKMMEKLKVELVCNGKKKIKNDEEGYDNYKEKKKKGKFKLMKQEKKIKKEKIVERIIKKRLEFENRNSEKEKKEIEILKKLNNESR